jgi:3-phosphoshikimate 1-carboxyvinyltransferase
MFEFSGELPLSKSIVQRVLLYRSFDRPPSFDTGESLHGVDATTAHRAFGEFASGERTLFCGESATLLRFLAVRASLERGPFVLKAGPTLAIRPMNDLLRFLIGIGAEKVQWGQGELKFEAKSWVDHVRVSAQETSQVASAAWICGTRAHRLSRLGFDPGVSSGFFELTQQVTRRLEEGAPVLEADAGCAFAIGALAAVAGRARMHGLPKKSLQPDAVGLRILEEMQGRVVWDGQGVTIKQGPLQKIHANLESAPDLFPVLAVLCAFAEGTSELTGAPHLRYKESDRLDGVSRLLTAMGVDHWRREDGMAVFGNPNHAKRVFDFDPHGDHRMVMAAYTAQAMGHGIRVRTPECVSKSFPEYLKCAHF